MSISRLDTLFKMSMDDPLQQNALLEGPPREDPPPTTPSQALRKLLPLTAPFFCGNKLLTSSAQA